jgi:tetratricopeptide (TPR) repeat protein
VDLAFEVADQSNADALKLLQINKEFYPESAINSYALGKVYVELKDTANAVTSFKKALELNPNFRRAQHELDALSGKK